MGSKSKTKSTQTTTPTVAEPYSTSFKNYTGQIDDFMAMDPTQFVAPTSALQQAAFDKVGTLGAGTPHIDAASGYAASAANAGPSSVSYGGYTAPKLGKAKTAQSAELGDAAQLLEFMQQYQNPYTEQVIDATLADYDEYSGRQRAQMAGDAGKTEAFGGSRYGIAQGQLEGELARGRASTEAALLDQQFRLAAQLAGQDAGAANQFGLQQGMFDQQTGQFNAQALNNFILSQAGLNADAARFGAEAANNQSTMNASLLEQSYQRALAAAGLEGQLAQTASQQELAQLAAMAELGGVQRGIASEYSNAYPTQLQMAGQLYGSLYPGLYSGQNQTGTSTQKSGGVGSWAPQVAGSAMQAGAMAFSDRRLKTDIERIGDYGKIGRYSYRISGRPEIGVMADEVATHYPEALGPVIAGFATVDYAKLAQIVE